MNKQELKVKKLNKSVELETGSGFGQIEERLAYLNMNETKASEYKCFIIVLVLLIAVVAFGCEDQGKDLLSNSQLGPSAQQQVSSPATIASSATSKQAALNRINYLFKGELSPIKPEQVQGINKLQLVQWVRNSTIAAAEKQHLAPLLSSNVNEIILIKGVTDIKTGKLTDVAMVEVPAGLIRQYTKLLVLKAYTMPFLRRLCFRFHCDNLEPTMCLCLSRIESVPLSSPCSSSECHPFNKPCRDQSGGPCGDPRIDQLIRHW